MTLEELTQAARAAQLDVFGHVVDGDNTVLLLGPHEPGFWSEFSTSPEYLDGQPDPLDRWSKRVVMGLAMAWGGQALFPSDGPPYPPFFHWAQNSGRAWQSPVTLLVHDRAGLWVSYRGAIRLPFELHALAPAPAPCGSCHAPCKTACPVNALTDQGYDLDRCHAHLDTQDGQDCMTLGCKVRAVCPLSQSYGRLAKQSHFHMKAFHPHDPHSDPDTSRKIELE
ncbi:ferredoxin [Aliiroseovarius sp. KMU-50]|uniref:Ferredoxin n=1 Tax=Aliiroseovarius salicola TaxID=3009082 RepID=A0ABT4VYF0_9RHOB|nr:ferredoxin [Aliiroseovarius sp. KMU-50]MDA5093296.1 ferredoxin [Aliiroseovarius sp. KMU-50]